MNIACGESCNLLDLIRRMAKIIGVAPDHDEKPPRVGDVLHSRADISRAQALLGYEPLTTLDAGLADTIEYYRQALAASH